MKRQSAAGALFVVAASVIWGSVGLFVRQLNAAGFSTFETLAARSLPGMLFAGLYLLLFQPAKLRIRLRDIWCFLGTGLLNMMVSASCYFTGMRYASLSVLGALAQTGPMFAMLFGVLLFQEKFTLRKGAAMLLTFLGCCLVSGIGSGDHISWPGLLLGLGAGVGYSMYSVFGRYAIRRGYDSWTITFYSFVFCSLGCSFVTDWQLVGRAVSADLSMLWWIAGLGLVVGFAAYVLYTKGLEKIDTGRAAILSSLEMVTAALIGTFVYREPLTLGIGCGILLVLSGIVVSSLRKS